MNNILFQDIPIIMGGMGVYISTPSLAKEVSLLGGLGTVSGTAADRVMAAILAIGDPGGHFRRALSHFPFQESAQRVLDTFYIEQGDTKKSRRAVPVYSINPSRLSIELIVCANFAFVWLAKEGHDHPISVNYLEKIAMPHVYALTGAVLAGIDVITMGAGLPLHIPPLIDRLIQGQPVEYPVPIIGEKTPHTIRFDPKRFFGEQPNPTNRPCFVPVISSNSLAQICAERLPEGSVQGFVVEESTAGGHNAPPRGRPITMDNLGQPVYGDRDKVDYRKLADLGFPFWIGGSYASPEKLAWAKENGAQGIQVGTCFAFCDQSGLDPVLREKVRRAGYRGEQVVFTDPVASPTGFPFKVAEIPGTLSEKNVYDSRPRICNQGALATLYRRPDGSIGYRCGAENADRHIKKGGKLEDTIGRKCICNGLISAAGLNHDQDEPPIVTFGDDLSFLHHLMSDENSGYSAKDVFQYLLERG